MNGVLETISEFQLEVLSDDWVENTWNSDFSGEKVTPTEYEISEEEIVVLMHKLIDAIKNWTNTEEPIPSSSRASTPVLNLKTWQSLFQCGIDHRALVCLLSTYIQSGLEVPDSIVLALTASRLYVNLLSIPGAQVFNVFNPYLFGQVTKALKYGRLCSTFKRIRKPKSRRNQREGDELDVSDNENESTPVLSDENKRAILYEIYLYLHDLSFCLKELRLAEERDSRTQVIQALTGLIRLETETYIFNTSEPPRFNSVGYIALKSFKILNELCKAHHGEIKDTIMAILSCLLHSLAKNEENKRMDNDAFIILVKNTFSFVQQIITNHQRYAEKGTIAFIQQILVRLPDLKGKVLPEIVLFLKPLPSRIFQNLVLWIISLAHTDTTKLRTVAVELISGLLNVSDEGNNEENSSTNDHPENVFLNKVLFAVVLSKCFDVSPIIRQKSVGMLAGLISSKEPQIKQVVTELFITVDVINESDIPDIDAAFFDFNSFFDQKKAFSDLTDPLPPAICIIKLIERLITDDKAYVRRNSIQAMTNIFLLNEGWTNEYRLKLITSCSRDFSIAIRKHIIKCLTDLILKYPSNEYIIVAWVDGVLTLVADVEKSCQDKVIESVQAVIFNNAIAFERSILSLYKLPWEVLKVIIRKLKTKEFTLCCKIVIMEKKSVRKTIFQTLRSHIGTENNFEAWFLLACLCQFLDCPWPKVIYTYYFDKIHLCEDVEEGLSKLVLKTFYYNCKNLDNDLKEDSYIQFRKAIGNFEMPFPLISYGIDICMTCKKTDTIEWCGDLVKKCEAFLEKHIAPGSIRPIEQIICRYIFTLGDAVNYHPGLSESSPGLIAKVIDPLFNTEGNDHLWIGTVSAVVKSVSVVTLGKICLQDHSAAQKFLPLFSHILHNPFAGVPVKINAMIALQDICSRFTSDVEEYISAMYVSLQDTNIHVRKNSLSVLMGLIQQDYLKLKNPLFFYMLIMLMDKYTVIREMTDAFLSNYILVKMPHIMSQFFIQAIYFFNDYEGKEGCSKEDLSEREKSVFAMDGAHNFKRRSKIYRYMLNHMQDDRRFKLSNRLCFDILEDVCKGAIPLNPKGTSVLKDALFALSCDEMRLENLRMKDEQDQESEVLTCFRKVFLNQIVKKNYIESIMPIITRLKRKLTSMNSPLVKDVMICLREIMKDFKEEVNEILASDLEIAAEVTNDLKNINPDDTITEDYDDLTQKELEIQCERLTEEMLLEKFGISLSNIQLTSPPPSDMSVAGRSRSSSFMSSPPNPLSPPAGKYVFSPISPSGAEEISSPAPKSGKYTPRRRSRNSSKSSSASSGFNPEVLWLPSANGCLQPTTNYTLPSTSGYSQLKSSGFSQVSSSGHSQPSASGYSQPSVSACSQPSTSGCSQPSTSGYSQPSTSGNSQPSTSGNSQPSTSGNSQPSTSGNSQPSTSGCSQPSTSGYTPPSTSGVSLISPSGYFDSAYSEPSTSGYSEPSHYSTSEYSQSSTSSSGIGGPIGDVPSKCKYLKMSHENDTFSAPGSPSVRTPGTPSKASNKRTPPKPKPKKSNKRGGN